MWCGAGGTGLEIGAAAAVEGLGLMGLLTMML